MALRPEIALGVRQPDIINPGQLLSLQNLSQQGQLGQMQIEDALQGRSERDQLKALFQNPEMVDPQTGTVSLKGITSAYGVSPEQGSKLAAQRQVSLKQAAEMAKLNLETLTAKTKMLRDSLATVTDQPSYEAWVNEARQQGAAVAQRAPATFDPKWQRQNVLDASKFIEQNTPKIEMKDVGGKLVPVDTNPVTNPTIKGTSLEKTPTPDAQMSDLRIRAEGAANRAVTTRGQDLVDARSRDTAASTLANQTNQQENKMRDDYTKASGKFVEVRDAYQRVIESAKNPSAAGDIALIFSFMRALDPASTVREGEFATAQNAAGIPERVRAQYNKAINGERLSDSTRGDFVDRSKRLYQGALVNQEELEKDYEAKSKTAGVRAEQVVTKYRVKEPPEPAKSEKLTPAEQEELKALRARFRKP